MYHVDVSAPCQYRQPRRRHRRYRSPSPTARGGLAVDPVVVQVPVPGGSIARGSNPHAEVDDVLRQLVLGADLTRISPRAKGLGGAYCYLIYCKT